MPMALNAKIYVAGHRGLAGSAIVRLLRSRAYSNIITRDKSALDLRDKNAVDTFFSNQRPDYVFGAAAKVGGIMANAEHPAEFLYDNLMIAANLVDACHRHGVQKLLFLGSTCVYPKHAPQPMREDDLLTGPLEQTNAAYAIAKIAGLKLCEAYADQYGLRSVTLMPTNLYGPGDNFDLNHSHVIPALMRKAHEAKMAGVPSMTVWGTGAPLREFLYIEDMAEACLFAMNTVEEWRVVNAGSSEETSVAQLARLIAEVVGYRGDLVFDVSKPDGTPRKLADLSRMNSLGWRAKTRLDDGLAKTYEWYVSSSAKRL